MTLTQGLQPSAILNRPVVNLGAVPHKGRREDASSASSARTLGATIVPRSSIERSARHEASRRLRLGPTRLPIADKPETGEAQHQHRPG